jgi:hypothetical protein
MLSPVTPTAQAIAPSSPTCAQGGVCTIGEIGPGGGRVFYVQSGTFTQVGATAGMCTTNCKYLEAAPTSGTNAWADNSYLWSDVIDLSIVTRGTAIGTGFSNTVAMVTQSATANRAGSITRAYRGPNDVSDWYLASKDELNQLCRWARGNSSSNDRCSGGNINTGPGATGFKDGSDGGDYYYWSSSEDTAGEDASWAQRFSRPLFSSIELGEQGIIQKSRSVYVRPIRAFAPATKVAITRASAGTERRTAFTIQPQITIQYANSDTATVSTSVVTATVSTGGTLVGTTTATASAGTATFSGLGVDGIVGEPYTITYTAEGLTVATATVTLTGTTCDGASLTCQVGDTGPGGGKIFYVTPTTFTQLGATGFMCSTACKYLEAAPTTGASAWTDIQRSWATDVNSNRVTSVSGAVGTAIGSGYQNSKAIVAQSGNVTETSAAVAARGYTVGSLTDWYLPSQDELTQLWNNRVTVGGFQNGDYWSSSESAPESAEGRVDGPGWTGTFSKASSLYFRPIRAFGTAPTSISVFAIGGVTTPVIGTTPVNTVTASNGYTGTVTWSGSPTTFASSTVYTATITLTAAAGYTLAGVGANSYRVAGATSITHSADSGVITAVFSATAAPTPTVVYVPPTPVPYLKTLTSPKLNLKDGKLICMPGTYNAGYNLDGVVQGSGTALFTPSSITYNLLINGITQTSLAVTSSTTSNSWNIPASVAGALITCSVTVSANGVTNTDKSSDNSSGVNTSFSTQTNAITTANAEYSAAVSANSKAHQKALIDNRAKWRSDTEKSRTDYYAERDRIKLLPSTKTTRAQASAALKTYIAAQKKSAADYRASQPAAAAARDAANKAALGAKTTAIAKANAAYGTFIESIGYGVLIP